jgi:polyisoprenoid-binding protein YceI
MKSLVLAAALVAGPAFAVDYAVVPDKSVLRFIGDYEGESFEGGFGRFTATVSIDPANAGNTKLAAEIDVASANTENEERDQTLATAEFFDAAKFPKATFRTLACRGAAPSFTCDAELTIRDRTQKLAFPFTLTPQADGGARLEADVVLKRLAFDVGTGDWADTALIGDDVRVHIDLMLKPKT